jgi:putative acetyltransferase
MDIRSETPDDIIPIRDVLVAAFGRENEANLVEQLRGVPSTLSCVAVDAETVIGHIFFSPVSVVGKECSGLILGLAPLAVLPSYQRQGIGSLLIQHGLDECRQLGGRAVVVLGHSDYYPRFGFHPAHTRGLLCSYPVPDEAFMVMELVEAGLEGCSGTVHYRPEFDACG